MYLRGIDQLQLIEAVKERTLDLLIPKGTKERWQKLLSKTGGDYRLHERTSFETLGQTLKETKIFLHSAPHIKRGTDGMAYTALQYGAYAISSQNPYLLEEFSEEEGIWFYHYHKQDELRAEIDKLLSDPSTLQASVDRGHKRVKRDYTWREFAKTLLEKLPPLLTDLPYGLQPPAEKS
jgi:glycosyltransferase involved in cell wall biosynthesis